MLAKRTMIGFILLCVLLGLVFGYTGGIGIKTVVKEMIQNSKENAEKGTPVKSITITIQAGQQELLFDQLHKFAEKNFFAIRITDFKPSSYLIEMWREDVRLFGSFQIDSQKLSLSLNYNYFEQAPSQPVSVTVFDDLIDDLEIYTYNIPDAIITERQHLLVITTNNNWQDEELFLQMKALAERHSLEYSLSFYGSDPSDKSCFLVEVRGKGFHITSDCYHNSLNKLNVEFYLDYYKNSPSTSDATLEGLFNELKGVLDNSPNATIAAQP